MRNLASIPRPVQRALYRLGASVFLLLGMVGVVVPLMPTTVFLLLSAWCLIKLDDPRVDQLLQHPRVGPPLRLFMERGQVTRRGKLMALGGMSFGAGGMGLLAGAHPWLAGGAIGVLAVAALYVATRPEPGPQPVRI